MVVWCRLFDWKEIGALLRLKRNRLFSYKLYAKVLCLIGLGAGVLRLVLPSLSFFLPLVLSPKLLLLSLLLFVVFSCSSWTPCTCFIHSFFMINTIPITYQKYIYIYITYKKNFFGQGLKIFFIFFLWA